MLKTAATYATFLVVVSALYYVSFWWAFDIDVLPFFEAQDFLLGIIFPLRYSGTYFLAMLMGFGLVASFINLDSIIARFSTDYSEHKVTDEEMRQLEQHPNQQEFDRLKKKIDAYQAKLAVERAANKKRQKIASLFITLTAIGAIVVFIKYPYDRANSCVAAFMTAQAIQQVALLANGLPDNVLGLKKENEGWKFSIDYALILLLIFLPVSAITTAYSESQAILQGKNFRYTLPKNLPTVTLTKQQNYLVYLGAVNEKFIFTDSANTENIVIDKENLPILRVHSFDSNDKVSVARFARLTARPKLLTVKPQVLSPIAPAASSDKRPLNLPSAH